MMRVAFIILVACSGDAKSPPPATPTPPPPPDARVGVGESMFPTTLTPDVALGTVKAKYMTGVQRCYKSLLKKDASRRGKVQIAMTIGDDGRVTDASARGFDDTLDACIAEQAKGWEFPIPQDADGKPAEASFAFTLQLEPD
jgi:hypothetical protein